MPKLTSLLERKRAYMLRNNLLGVNENLISPSRTELREIRESSLCDRAVPIGHVVLTAHDDHTPEEGEGGELGDDESSGLSGG